MEFTIYWSCNDNARKPCFRCKHLIPNKCMNCPRCKEILKHKIPFLKETDWINGQDTENGTNVPAVPVLPVNIVETIINYIEVLDNKTEDNQVAYVTESDTESESNDTVVSVTDSVSDDTVVSVTDNESNDTVVTDTDNESNDTVVTDTESESNIYIKLKNNDIQSRFRDEIHKHYSLYPDTHIKESLWEDINCNVVNHIFNVSEKAKGNHKSGIDCKFDSWGISIKSSKIKTNKSGKQEIPVSSYRLTSVKDQNNITQLIDEIDERDKSFQYYSILARKECDMRIEYFWFIIPKNYYIFDPHKYEWEIKKNKQNKKSGWKSKYMTINDSMSSQLWFSMDFKDIECYCVANTIVELNRPNEYVLISKDEYEKLISK